MHCASLCCLPAPSQCCCRARSHRACQAGRDAVSLLQHTTPSWSLATSSGRLSHMSANSATPLSRAHSCSTWRVSPRALKPHALHQRSPSMASLPGPLFSPPHVSASASVVLNAARSRTPTPSPLQTRPLHATRTVPSALHAPVVRPCASDCRTCAQITTLSWPSRPRCRVSAATRTDHNSAVPCLGRCSRLTAQRGCHKP